MLKTLKIAPLAIGAILMGWAVVHTSAVNALVRVNPDLAARVAPGDPRVDMARAMTSFQRASTTTPVVSPELVARGKAALQKAPLAEEPFIFAGVAALAQRDFKAAEQLFAEGRRRNPRSRPARLFLLDNYLRTGRVDQAIGEISVINRLVPAASSLLVPELAKFASNPQTSRELARVIDSDPDLKIAVLNQLVANKTAPEIVLQMAGSDLRPSELGSTPDWQIVLLNSLVEKDETQRARNLWRRFAGVGADQNGGIYDAAFEGRPGSAPFNWTLLADSKGVAEPNGAKGLDVAFYGRESASLAQQLLTLAPGRYRLSMNVSGDSSEDGAGMAWTLKCGVSGPVIANLAMGSLSIGGTNIGTTFDVPGGCPGQWLMLVGTSSEFPNTRNLTISALSLTKADES